MPGAPRGGGFAVAPAKSYFSLFERSGPLFRREVDAADARRVADRLELPFYSLDFSQDFVQVMDYFADEYLAGRTPRKIRPTRPC